MSKESFRNQSLGVFSALKNHKGIPTEAPRKGLCVRLVPALMLLALGGAMLGGCDEPSSPHGAVKRAAVAALKADPSALKQSLSGAALRKFGSADAALSLAETLKGKDLELAPAALRYRDQSVAGFDSLRIYSVPVMDKQQGVLALETTVICTVDWVSQNGYGYRRSAPQQPSAGARPSDGYTAIESCRVSEVKLPSEGLTPPGSLCDRTQPGGSAEDCS